MLQPENKDRKVNPQFNAQAARPGWMNDFSRRIPTAIVCAYGGASMGQIAGIPGSVIGGLAGGFFGFISGGRRLPTPGV